MGTGTCPTNPSPILESPMSFVGATRRMVRPVFNIPQTWGRILTFTLLVLAVLPVVYCLLAAWYVLAFGVFGWLVIPWRLHRRAQRAAQHTAKQQAEVLYMIAQNTMNTN